jgi:hypothetical protein
MRQSGFYFARLQSAIRTDDVSGVFALKARSAWREKLQSLMRFSCSASKTHAYRSCSRSGDTHPHHLLRDAKQNFGFVIFQRRLNEPGWTVHDMRTVHVTRQSLSTAQRIALSRIA